MFIRQANLVEQEIFKALKKHGFKVAFFYYYNIAQDFEQEIARHVFAQLEQIHGDQWRFKPVS